jgi:flagellar M-ring protein FliF
MPVIIQFFKDMSAAKLAAFGLSFLVFVILFILYISKISGKDMSLLYSDLDIEDSGKIVKELENKSIPYQIFDDGRTIKVPHETVAKLRVDLAQEGIPNKGSVIGYEIFDKEDSIGTTNFSQNVKMARALEGEISRTISSFEQVDRVRVHLVLPQKEIFSKERLEPRASIVIRFKNNKFFNKSEVDAISHLIVTSVPGLDIKNITIADTKGRSLKLGGAEETSEFTGLRGDEYRVAYENRLKKVVEDLLEQTLGVGKAKAQVNVTMNFDRIVTNAELYDPESAVIRSVQSSDERQSSPAGGEDNLDISVANNLPGSSSSTADSQRLSISEKNEQTTNYEISKTVKNQISETGIVTKLSIGVLIDGTYKLNSETNKMDYNPRNKTEIEQITNLVKAAVGFSAERNDEIEVVNMQFAGDFDVFDADDNSHWLKEELPNLFQTLVFAVVVVLVLVTVIRPITLKAFELRNSNSGLLNGMINGSANNSNVADVASSTENGSQTFGTNPDFVDNPKIEKNFRTESNSKKINDLVEFYPQEMLNVLRKWLEEGK